jgi:hypothetical protein
MCIDRFFFFTKKIQRRSWYGGRVAFPKGGFLGEELIGAFTLNSKESSTSPSLEAESYTVFGAVGRPDGTSVISGDGFGQESDREKYHGCAEDECLCLGEFGL